MLIGINPLLHPDILHTLAAMGHGDRLAIVDANFPSASIARGLVVRQPLQINCDAVTAVKAALSVFPIDKFEPGVPPVEGMAVVGDPDAIPAVVAEAAPLFAAQGHAVSLIERFAFYDAVRSCFAIIRTCEERPYGNFVIRKGTVGF